MKRGDMKICANVNVAALAVAPNKNDDCGGTHMTKLRSINDAFIELKANDPDTAMTQSGLRRLVNTGKIPHLRIGRRILINFKALVDYLNHPANESCADDDYGKVRKIV